jgi:hypothetical protein
MATLTIVNVDNIPVNASGFYDEIEIEDMDFNEETQTYYYPCPWYRCSYIWS